MAAGAHGLLPSADAIMRADEFAAAKSKLSKLKTFESSASGTFLSSTRVFPWPIRQTRFFQFLTNYSTEFSATVWLHVSVISRKSPYTSRLFSTPSKMFVRSSKDL